MKNFLVVYSTGVGTVGSAVVSMPMDYSPTDDKMEALKRKVVDEYRPRHVVLTISSNYRISKDKGQFITAEELVVINVQRLNL